MGVEHAIFDWLHLFASVGLGIGAALWGLAKWIGHRYSERLGSVEKRLTEVERDYVTRTSVEAILARIEQRIDDLYRVLHH